MVLDLMGMGSPEQRWDCIHSDFDACVVCGWAEFVFTEEGENARLVMTVQPNVMKRETFIIVTRRNTAK